MQSRGVRYEAKCACFIVVRGAEAGIAMTEGVRECIVQHRCSRVEGSVADFRVAAA
jgi:hypothetical protein